MTRHEADRRLEMVDLSQPYRDFASLHLIRDFGRKIGRFTKIAVEFVEYDNGAWSHRDVFRSDDGERAIIGGSPAWWGEELEPKPTGREIEITDLSAHF